MKEKYKQWGLEDSLTRSEMQKALRVRLSKVLKVKIRTEADVERWLRVYSQLEERGLIQ